MKVQRIHSFNSFKRVIQAPRNQNSFIKTANAHKHFIIKQHQQERRGFKNFTTQTTTVRMDKYSPPSPLVKSLGSKWSFQRPLNIQQTLHNELFMHYHNWKEGITERSDHPLFFILGGLGTGKSRILDEFLNMAQNAVSHCGAPELISRLSPSNPNLLTFAISFEGETPYSPVLDTTADIALGTRMLYQFRESQTPDFESLVKDPLNRVTPSQVIQKIASSRGISTEELTILFLVDDIDKLPHEVPKNSPLSECISTLCNLINGGLNSFVISCCTSALNQPVAMAMSGSNQPLVYLFPEALDSRQIVQHPEPIINTLVEDIGGHGRALEVLCEALDKHLQLHNTEFNEFTSYLIEELSKKYPQIETFSEKAQPIFGRILSHNPVTHEEFFNKTEWSVDEVLSAGLLRFKYDTSSTEQLRGWIEYPYAWLWLVGNKLPEFFPFVAHLELADMSDEYRWLSALQVWHPFDEFAGLFRTIKGSSIVGQCKLSEIHHGARISRELTLISKPMGIVRAAKPYKTKSGSANYITWEFGCFRLIHGNKWFLNVPPNAPGADGFGGVKRLERRERTVIREVQDYRQMREGVITQELFDSELARCADPNVDLFVMITTGDASGVKLSDTQNSVIVDKSNFDEYFGAFRHRALLCLNGTPPEANSVTLFQLSAVLGMDKDRTNKFMTARANGPFKDIHDCFERTKIPIAVLQRLSWTNSNDVVHNKEHEK